MTPEQLLQECETLTYRDRMHRMVELGRLAASDASISQTITMLAQGNVFERVLAVQSCFGSRDSALALQALSDPSRSLRTLALDVVTLICSDDELQVIFDLLLPSLKVQFLHNLSRHRRYTVIDRHIEALASRGDAAIKKWLPFASREVVQRYLGQVVEQFDLVAWKRLAHRYPDLVIEQLHTLANSAVSLDPQLVIQVNTVLPLLTRCTPDLALTLVRTISSTIPLERLNIQALAQKRPNEVADLLIQTNEQSHVRFDAVTRRLDTEHLLTLFTRYPDTISNACFPKLTPEQRLIVYTACERVWRNFEGVLPVHIVANLPTTQRIQEAYRHIALPALVARPLERLRYAAYLPWDEAFSTLDTSLHSPDANLRGVALHALITTTRYQRDHLADVLMLVRRHHNEQDPVRREMLAALAELPHSIWRSEHLDDLREIICNALDAIDFSHATSEAVERLILYLFPFHPEWSAEQIVTILERWQGFCYFPGLDRYLSKADMQRIAPLLIPLLQLQDKMSEHRLILLTRALGKRLRDFDEVFDILEITAEQTFGVPTADLMLQLLLKYRKQRAAELILRLLQQDKSCIVIPAVHTYLHRYRQDLLTPFLGQNVYNNRFSTGSEPMVLPLKNGFFRWTPTQQKLFAQTLLETIDQQSGHIARYQRIATYKYRSTIRRLAAMPAIDHAPLIQFASDTQQFVRHLALQALGMLDAGQGIPALLAALDGESARIAIYALRGALFSMQRGEALNLLRQVSLSKVTVAKEVVRLIGDLSSEEAYRELLALDARNLHRDVHVALLRALWSYVEEEESWKIFTRAAQSPEIALARGVVDIPVDGMSVATRKRLAALIATLLAHPEPEVRIDALQRCNKYPLADDRNLLFSQLLALLNTNSPDECALAAKAIFAIFTGNNASLVGKAIAGLLSNRRALHISIENFIAALRSSRHYLLPTTRAILAALAGDQLTLSLRIELIVSGLPWDEVAQELEKLASGLHADALGRAEQAILRAHQRPDAQLLDLEKALATNSNEHLRRLALAALVAQSTKVAGWSDECIACLQRYRDDPSPLVAEAAQFTFVS